MKLGIAPSALLLALVLPLAACESVSTSPSGGAQARIVLNQGSAASTSLAASFSATAAALAGPVSLSDVKSIDLVVTGVQALPQFADSTRDKEWVSLEAPADTRINLLALPKTAETGLQLARGELLPGKYGNLRIVFSEATITFAKDVSAGGGPRAQTYRADSAYTLEIGGGERKAIVVPSTGFTVAQDSTTSVLVTFDGSASVRKVIVTPNAVRIAPVLTAQPTKGKK